MGSKADKSAQSEAVVVEPGAHLLGLANEPGLGLANALLPGLVSAVFQDELIAMVRDALRAYGRILLMSMSRAVTSRARCCLHGLGRILESFLRSL